MDRKGIQEQIDSINIELRSLMDAVKDTSKEINLEEVRTKKANLEEKRSKLEKELAEMERPAVEGKPETRTVWGDIAKAMVEKRTVTLNGAGTVATVKGLAKKIVNNTSILNGVHFFYGANAGTKVPVWGTQLHAAFLADGATGSAAANTMGVTSLDPQQALSSLPVSKMALDLGAANLEAELPELFSGAFSDLLADGMLNGKSFTAGSDTVVAMTGLFKDSNTTAFLNACTVVKLAELARTVKAKTYSNPVIIMSPAVYAKFLGDTSTDETTKIYKESLIRDKMIEGVSVVLTAYAPSTGSGSSGAWADGDVIAVAGDLSNYAIAMAGQIDIKAKETASSTVTTFDATIYAAGKPVISSDFYQFKIDL